MELKQSLRSLSPVKRYHIPPDVNTGTDLFTTQHWYSKIAIHSPAIHISHFIVALIFGTLSLIFGILSGNIIEEPSPFWDLFPEFLGAVITITVTCTIQFVILPAFWKCRARQLVNEGFFDSSTRINSRRRLVLELGCNDGKTSAHFAKAIIDRQSDVGDMNASHASLPIFIGYDRWSAWSRIPNTPACFLSTLTKAGVPRDCIIANRMDRTSPESKSHLPYLDGSISLVICNFGIGELLLNGEERTMFFHELIRVLEPEGKLLIVEALGVGKFMLKDLWQGALLTYRRILVDTVGWPEANVVIHRREWVRHLVAVKPSRMRQNV